MQHDRHVRGVEETDGVGSTNTTLTRGLDWDFDAEALKIDNSGKNDEGSNKVHDVREVLTVESFIESTLLIGPGEQEVEEGNDSSFELGSTTSVDGGRREGFPDDGLANVGGNEERDTASKTVTLLQELVKENNDKSGNNKLNNQKDTDTSSQVAGLTIKASKDVDTSLTKGQNDSKELLCGLVQLAIGFEVEVDIDELGSSKELKIQLE